jgi:hypothetical protein
MSITNRNFMLNPAYIKNTACHILRGISRWNVEYQGLDRDAQFTVFEIIVTICVADDRADNARAILMQMFQEQNPGLDDFLFDTICSEKRAIDTSFYQAIWEIVLKYSPVFHCKFFTAVYRHINETVENSETWFLKCLVLEYSLRSKWRSWICPLTKKRVSRPSELRVDPKPKPVVKQETFMTLYDVDSSDDVEPPSIAEKRATFATGDIGNVSMGSAAHTFSEIYVPKSVKPSLTGVNGTYSYEEIRSAKGKRARTENDVTDPIKKKMNIESHAQEQSDAVQMLGDPNPPLVGLIPLPKLNQGLMFREQYPNQGALTAHYAVLISSMLKSTNIMLNELSLSSPLPPASMRRYLNEIFLKKGDEFRCRTLGWLWAQLSIYLSLHKELIKRDMLEDTNHCVLNACFPQLGFMEHAKNYMLDYNKDKKVKVVMINRLSTCTPEGKSFMQDENLLNEDCEVPTTLVDFAWSEV